VITRVPELAAADHDVAFIARGAHRDAIRRDGLRIESRAGDLHLKDVNVTDDPKQIGSVDVVLFAVKLWDTEAAGEQTRPLVGAARRNSRRPRRPPSPRFSCRLLHGQGHEPARKTGTLDGKLAAGGNKHTPLRQPAMAGTVAKTK